MVSALDLPMNVTMFRSVTDNRCPARSPLKRRGITLRDLEQWAQEESGAEKSDLPLIKLGVFGDAKSEKGFYRHDANLLSVFGVECDYDGERMAMEEAAGLLRKAGVACLLYTTPSHTAKRPRWRVLTPCTNGREPAERARYVARINGVLGGVLKSESFAKSQIFYIGAVDGKPTQTILIDGDYIDERDDLDAGAIGKGEAARDSKPERDESRSGRHYTEALKSARAGRSYEEHLEGLDEELLSYASEGRGSETKGERDWARAETAVHKERGAVADKFDDHGQDKRERKRKQESTLEIFWGDADDGSADMEPLIDGFFFQRTLAAIYGRYGEGKSFAALDIGLHVATGRPWFGRAVAQGAVLYVAPEGYHGLKRRRAAWCKQHGLSRTPKEFALVRGSIDLQRADGVTLESLADAAREHRAKLIIIDTLNAVFGGADENESAAMSKARHELERLRDLSGATVLVIHHAGKDIERGLRGSSVLGGALDTILLVHGGRIISEPPKGKQKDSEAAPDIPFILHPVDLPPDGKGRPVSSAVIMAGAAERFEDHVKMTDDQKQAVDLLRRMERFTDINGPVTRESYRLELKRKAWGPKNPDTWRPRFAQLLKWLEREGLAELDSNGAIQVLT